MTFRTIFKNNRPGPMVAMLATALSTAEDSLFQLFPDGEFRSRDGRPAKLPHWTMNATIAARLIAEAAARETPYAIDYEHQSVNSQKNGQPAPAAGWFRELVYKPGEGLFAKVNWTARAKEMIEADEYKFGSPLFSYDPKTGEVLRILSAAVTNWPGLDGMREIEERAAATFGFSVDPDDEETSTVNFMQRLIAALGLAADADEDAVAGAVEALGQTVTDRDTEIATLKEKTTDEIDPAKYVKVEVVEALRGEIAELRTGHVGREVEDVITAALNDERGPLLLDAQLDWARDLGKKDMAALKAYLKTAAPMAALRGRQTAGRILPGPAQTIDDEGVAILTQLGLSAQEIEATKKEAQ